MDDRHIKALFNTLSPNYAGFNSVSRFETQVLFVDILAQRGQRCLVLHAKFGFLIRWDLKQRKEDGNGLQHSA